MTRCLIALAFVVAAALGGCGSDRADPTASATERAVQPKRELRAPSVPRARCDASAVNCASARGRVIFRELHDPDGDGDLHVVVAGGAITGPGITVLDVSKELRPRRDPRIGEIVSGAGPVYPGSYGQKQIQVEQFNSARR